MPKPSPFVVSTPMRECRLCSMRPCLGLKSSSSMSTGCPYHAIHRHIVSSFRGRAPPGRVVCRRSSGGARPVARWRPSGAAGAGTPPRARPPPRVVRARLAARPPPACPPPRGIRACGFARAPAPPRAWRRERAPDRRPPSPAIAVTAIGQARAREAAAEALPEGGGAGEPKWRPAEYRYGVVLGLVLALVLFL